MGKIEDSTRCLSAIALFGELYSQQRDVYDIVCLFINAVITKEQLKIFTIQDLQRSLQKNFDFSIPNAVIENVLKRKMKDNIAKSHSNYSVVTIHSDQIVDPRKNEIEKSHKKIIDELLLFIGEHKKRNISDDEKEKICNAFCSYLLDDEKKNTEYTVLIAAFFVSIKDDAECVKMVNTIREGAILYTGLVFSPESFSTIGHWKNDLTIFLDTEMMFHFAGYNGTVFKEMFAEFLQLVREVNTLENSKSRISLKYFQEIKKEIDAYFHFTENLVGKSDHDVTQDAMRAILDGCNNRADVLQRRAEFYSLLQQNGITEADVNNYYSEENNPYNLSSAIIEEFATSPNVLEDWTFLNYISILRKGKVSAAIDGIGSIFLTATNVVLRMALDGDIRQKGIPLATDIGTFTCKLWLKLNKGFGGNNVPKSFDVITNAQIVLSGQLNISLADKHAELVQKMKTGAITEDQAIELLASFKEQKKTPEAITKDYVDDLLSTLDKKSVDDVLKAHATLRAKSKEQQEENCKLLQKNNELEQKNKQAEETIEEKDAVINSYKEKDKQNEVKREKKQKRIKTICGAFFVLFILTAITAVIYYGYLNNVISIFSIIALVVTILGYLGLTPTTIKTRLTKK